MRRKYDPEDSGRVREDKNRGNKPRARPQQVLTQALENAREEAYRQVPSVVVKQEWYQASSPMEVQDHFLASRVSPFLFTLNFHCHIKNITWIVRLSV